MSRERKRERKKVIEPGVPIAEPGTEIIWNDPKLKVPFISNPFISRLKGRAFLEQMLAYNLYFDDLTQKWKPLSDITISTVKNLARYYPIDPTPPTILSDLPLRLDELHQLRVYDKSVKDRMDQLDARVVQLVDFNAGLHFFGGHTGTGRTTLSFPSGNFQWTAIDFYLDVTVVNITVSIKVLIGVSVEEEVFSELFTVVGLYERRVIFYSAKACTMTIEGSVAGSDADYRVTGSHLPFETPVLT